MRHSQNLHTTYQLDYTAVWVTLRFNCVTARFQFQLSPIEVCDWVGFRPDERSAATQRLVELFQQHYPNHDVRNMASAPASEHDARTGRQDGDPACVAARSDGLVYDPHVGLKIRPDLRRLTAFSFATPTGKKCAPAGRPPGPTRRRARCVWGVGTGLRSGFRARHRRGGARVFRPGLLGFLGA